MALCCNDLLILVTQAAVLVLMYAVCARWLSLTLSGCSEYALWATVVAGTHTGLLQLDLTLQGLTRTFMPRLYPYRAMQMLLQQYPRLRQATLQKRRIWKSIINSIVHKKTLLGLRGIKHIGER